MRQNPVHLTKRALTTLALCLGSASAWSATPSAPANSDVQARYEQERARCLSGQSGQSQETCLKEAGAAREAARQGQLNDGDAKYRKNAKDRCEALAGDEKRDCIARARVQQGKEARGVTTESGSVKGGGILRETTTIVPAPAASAASAP